MSINCEMLDLRAFLAIVDLHGFHRAAEALNLSQSALTRRIQKLEAAVGAPLLERTTRQVSLTAIGSELIPLVRRMLEEFDSSLFAVRELGRQSGALVTIACIPTAAFYFLPTVIKEFTKVYPNIRFRILDLTAVDGLLAVARGEVEFGINIMGSSDPDLEFLHLADDPFVLATLKDHPLAHKDRVRWSDLGDYPLITVHRSSGNRTLLDTALVQHGVQLRWTYEVTHLSTSLGLVEQGLGISVLPRLATPSDDHPFLVTRPLDDPLIVRPIGVVQRRNATLSPAAGRFLDMLLGAWKGDVLHDQRSPPGA